VLDDIATHPWQTDTCVGQWHYRRGVKYKSAKKVIDLLVDIVSKNGNLLLNFPLPNSGELDPEEVTTLEGITGWMAVNSEGIYASRPWKIYGEGPSTKVVIAKNGKEFDPNEGKKPDLTASDVRFTTKGKTIYAFVQGWPSKEAVITSLGTGSPHATKVTSAKMLGHDDTLKFTQQADGLHVTMPAVQPTTASLGIALKLTTV
jgi:alpha-L-fucosidase